MSFQTVSKISLRAFRDRRRDFGESVCCDGADAGDCAKVLGRPTAAANARKSTLRRMWSRMDVRGPVIVSRGDRAAFPRGWIKRSGNPSRTRKLRSTKEPGSVSLRACRARGRDPLKGVASCEAPRWRAGMVGWPPLWLNNTILRD